MGYCCAFRRLIICFRGVLRRRRQVLETALDDAARRITQARDAVQDLRSRMVRRMTWRRPLRPWKTNWRAAKPLRTGDGPAFSVRSGWRGAGPRIRSLRDEIYRIAGEAVRNAFRHARARRIEVEIRYEPQQLRVRVRDDGIGMDSSSV